MKVANAQKRKVIHKKESDLHIVFTAKPLRYLNHESAQGTKLHKQDESFLYLQTVDGVLGVLM